ncbi:MAG: transcriptional repressor [Tannerella sp.]|jgi:Fur family ferric uptake transcriptional regulator|nr:transcriptional repressor [Tannerella sp.]
MNPDLHDADSTGKFFDEYLTEHGLRKSTVRKVILEHICRIRGYFDVDMLHGMLEADNFHVSKASIYNAIELLMNACLVVRHQFTTQVVYYELKSAAAGHLHAVCRCCGSVKEIRSDRVARLMTDLKIAKFSPEYGSMYIYGICSKCKYRLAHAKRQKNKQI